MTDCLFCRIVRKEIPSSIVFEDESVLAFKDINPAAPVHILIIPKEHIASASEIDKNNSAAVAHIFEAAAIIAKDQGIADNGYRIVTNIGRDGGQVVPHLHYHLLGGRNLQWPPG